eukprot:CAMPEP_0168546956 /NCGR_PEP_ID=MMETSP0413-20121227/3773_1 /TAXON_ID=136452 /ORGANISM="Filamoeba nolandi, Strain NC-AS-23-1" /LENGTH=350 /DNA_ID=CAMNT_0008577165 /DNA_START=624 /DNA_END=1677 /DNA_ORIENTATION=+
MAELLHRTGKLEDAIIEYSSTIPLLQDTVHLEHAHRRLAYALLDLYKQHGSNDILLLQQAIDYFSKAIEISAQLVPAVDAPKSNPAPSNDDTLSKEPYAPGSPEANKVDAFYGRALCYIQLKDWSHAQADLQHAVEVDTEFAPAYFSFGEVYRHQEKYLMAAGMYDRYFQKFPKYFTLLGADASGLNSEELLSDLQCKQAYCYLKISDWAMAEHCVDIVIHSNNFHIDKAWHLKGKCAQQRADWWKVIEANSQAIKANPELAQAFADRSEAYVQLGLLEEAKKINLDANFSKGRQCGHQIIGNTLNFHPNANFFRPRERTSSNFFRTALACLEYFPYTSKIAENSVSELG